MLHTNRMYAGHYGDEVYDLLSASFDDPSATIVYPYVYRILNSSSRTAAEVPLRANGLGRERVPSTTTDSPALSRPISPQGTVSSRRSSSHGGRSQSVSSVNGNDHSPSLTAEEPDLDEQLTVIIRHISSETTGAMHKEGITELHHFLKAYPHKKPKVDKMLESTGPAFRKYITRALASRAAEDQERDVTIANTLSSMCYIFIYSYAWTLTVCLELESNSRERVTSIESHGTRKCSSLLCAQRLTPL